MYIYFPFDNFPTYVLFFNAKIITCFSRSNSWMCIEIIKFFHELLQQKKLKSKRWNPTTPTRSLTDGSWLVFILFRSWKKNSWRGYASFIFVIFQIRPRIFSVRFRSFHVIRNDWKKIIRVNRNCVNARSDTMRKIKRGHFYFGNVSVSSNLHKNKLVHIHNIFYIPTKI